MSEEEIHDKAIQQREENIVLLRSIRFVIAGVGTAIVGLTAAGVVALVNDHFKLDQLVELHRTALILSAKHEDRLNAYAKTMFPIETRWSWPMQKVFADQLHQRNPTMDVPPAKDIHEDGLIDMKAAADNP